MKKPIGNVFSQPIQRPPNVPENWICNVHEKHGPVTLFEDTDLRKNEELPCACPECLKKAYPLCPHLFESPFLLVGDPIQLHPSYPVEKLKELGFVGIYIPRLRIEIEGK